jgi:hypothetical protein
MRIQKVDYFRPQDRETGREPEDIDPVSEVEYS